MNLEGLGGGIAVIIVVDASIHGYVVFSVDVSALEKELRGGVLLGGDDWVVGGGGRRETEG